MIAGMVLSYVNSSKARVKASNRSPAPPWGAVIISGQCVCVCAGASHCAHKVEAVQSHRADSLLQPLVSHSLSGATHITDPPGNPSTGRMAWSAAG